MNKSASFSMARDSDAWLLSSGVPFSDFRYSMTRHSGLFSPVFGVPVQLSAILLKESEAFSPCRHR